MDSELRKLTMESLELARENNKMLHGMRRSARISSFFRFAYWFVIIGITLGSFYFIQPYVEKISSIYTAVEKDSRSIQSVRDSLNNFIK